MMEPAMLRLLAGFYENELCRNILPFWMGRCLDEVHGGYLNCFTNDGARLVSRDKYTWSQGRFVWIFARLATLEAPIFADEERQEFLRYAKSGRDFLMAHCLMGPEDWRCVFLTDEAGAPKEVTPGAPLDMSIYADAFVVLGLARYALAAGDKEAYVFGEQLYRSCLARVDAGSYHTLPYPLSERFRAHGIPMIFCDVTREMALAAGRFHREALPELRARLEGFAGDVLTNFVDENHLIREVVGRQNQKLSQILGRHINPGHSLEDVWFLLNAADYLGRPQWAEKARAIALKTLEIGWDQAYGGLLHFCGLEGGRPQGDEAGVEDEPMLAQMKSGWGDKLWWVHSEALYTTLRCALETGDTAFWQWHKRLLEYTFGRFPNPDRAVGEWVQILQRDGTPQEKVVALPVKDPYHITRNLLLLLELLHAPAAR